MSRLPDNVRIIGDDFILNEYLSGGEKGFWLYDKARGMNLAMRAESAEAAFIEVIRYYRKRLLEFEAKQSETMEHIERFIGLFKTEE